MILAFLVHLAMTGINAGPFKIPGLNSALRQPRNTGDEASYDEKACDAPAKKASTTATEKPGFIHCYDDIIVKAIKGI